MANPLSAAETLNIEILLKRGGMDNAVIALDDFNLEELDDIMLEIFAGLLKKIPNEKVQAIKKYFLWAKNSHASAGKAVSFLGNLFNVSSLLGDDFYPLGCVF